LNNEFANPSIRKFANAFGTGIIHIKKKQIKQHGQQTGDPGDFSSVGQRVGPS
jgi:hypothetical protein